jgi:hypothetical protein
MAIEEAPMYRLVADDLRVRHEVGVRTYGSPLTMSTEIDSLWYAYEEALDLACYLRKLILERDGDDVPALRS